jgi:hypothetical protein
VVAVAALRRAQLAVLVVLAWLFFQFPLQITQVQPQVHQQSQQAVQIQF